MKVLIETSARHVHLTDQDFRILFGNNASLTLKKYLSQPGQYACNERVSLVGPKNLIENVIIIGPVRSKSQVEISLTDARNIGLNVPVRLSGDIEGSGGCKLIGPTGELDLKQGVIAAKRHIHMTEKDAALLNLTENDKVMVEVKTVDRPVIFDDVDIRISNNFKLAMHIDTDEANAANCVGKVYGDIIVKKYKK